MYGADAAPFQAAKSVCKKENTMRVISTLLLGACLIASAFPVCAQEVTKD
jgi:hypothetical protein